MATQRLPEGHPSNGEGVPASIHNVDLRARDQERDLAKDRTKLQRQTTTDDAHCKPGTLQEVGGEGVEEGREGRGRGGGREGGREGGYRGEGGREGGG